MVNREIFELLKSINLSGPKMRTDKVGIQLEVLGRELIQKIRNKFPSNKGRNSNGVRSRFNYLKKGLYVEFELLRGATSFIQISYESLLIGFKINSRNKIIAQDFTSPSKQILSRYFDNYNCEQYGFGEYKLSATHGMNVRNLNSRDFIDYLSFLYERIIDLVNDIETINASRILQKSA